MVDVLRLRKALEHITAHPEEWKQDSWAKKTSCGTAFCLAGHVVVQEHGLSSIKWERIVITSVGWETETESGSAYISDEAARLLNLTAEQRTMFGGDNSLERLWELANEYTDGEIEVPADL